MRHEYESSPEYPESAYAIDRHPGIAWRILGWETEYAAIFLCADCDCTTVERQVGGGYVLDDGNPECEHESMYQSDEPEFERTGALVCIMVGDDAHWIIDPADVSPLDDLAYCHECGQIGCAHDGLDRSEME